MKNLGDEDFDYGISAEPETAFIINRELNMARRIVEETASNLFLTGKAGTGKTTFLRQLRETSRKRIAVLAPTGVAAINAGGMTMHSFFQLPFSPYVPGRGFIGEEKRFFRFGREKRRLIASLDLIVIDEISMVRPDTLDAIDSILRKFRNPGLPFGGTQLLLIGDLRQLAPVVRPDEWEMLRQHYRSPYFFESHALRESGFLTVELRTIYRQEEQDFISLLNAVREGKATPDVLDRLNSLCVAQGKETEENNPPIKLTSHNHISDRTNSEKLQALDGEPAVFEARVTGHFPESSFPVDRFLSIKKGARVMFIKNDSGPLRQYYNGMIGTVTEIGPDTVTVSPDETPDEIITGYEDWENITYEVDEQTKEITTKIDGVFSQIPLRLAWSITIHKSQGLTFDRAVIDAGRSFAPGQLYVALSRCRSLKGLRLESMVPPSAVIIDRDVNAFIDESRKNIPDDSTLSMLRDEYFRKLLCELFCFRNLRQAFSDFARCVKEYVAPIHTELFAAYAEAEQTVTEKIADVGDRFVHLYASHRIDADSISANEQFNAKIKGGCSYFLDRLASVSELCGRTPLSIDNRQYAARLEKAADILEFEIKLKRAILKGFTEESFSPASYLRLKADAVLDFKEKDNPEPEKRSRGRQKTAKTSKEKTPKKPKGYSERESLKLYREGHEIREIAEIRSLTPATIVIHLAKMAEAGEIDPQTFITSDKLAQLKAIYEETRGTDPAAFRIRALESADELDLSIFFECVVRRKIL